MAHSHANFQTHRHTTAHKYPDATTHVDASPDPGGKTTNGHYDAVAFAAHPHRAIP